MKTFSSRSRLKVEQSIQCLPVCTKEKVHRSHLPKQSIEQVSKCNSSLTQTELLQKKRKKHKQQIYFNQLTTVQERVQFLLRLCEGGFCLWQHSAENILCFITKHSKNARPNDLIIGNSYLWIVRTLTDLIKTAFIN